MNPLEVRALENAVSQNTMCHWGWHADESGRITTDTSQTVFAAGFVTAIRKVLANAGLKPQLTSHDDLMIETGNRSNELIVP